MRFEELSDSRYIKGPDTVERYLLNLVQEYFKNSNIASTTSREYIIQRAVQRMKEEISFESIGVLSITLPDGQVRTGSVSISLAELGGEPLIFPKRTAFNVNFGQEANTACEGNDPRLSDTRQPTQHEHDIKDVIGLEGILSTLTGKINRVNGLMHDHSNKTVLDMLTYTGMGNSIDLTIIDTIDTQVQGEIDAINKEIQTFKTEIRNKEKDYNQTAQDVKDKLDDVVDFVNNTSDSYLAQAKQYTDDEIRKLNQQYSNVFDGYVTRDMLTNSLANALSKVGDSIVIPIKTVLQVNSSVTSQEVEIGMPLDVIQELQLRKQTLNDCQIEVLIDITGVDSIQRLFPSPYVIYGTDSTYATGRVTHILCGGVSLSSANNYNLKIMYSSFVEKFPDELVDAKIIFNLYSKQDVTL